MLTKVDTGNGTCRLFDESGEPVARIWQDSVADRILRDFAFAEALLEADGRATRRRDGINDAVTAWQLAGGASVDFAALTFSQNDDAGKPDGGHGIHLFIAGNEVGVIHGLPGGGGVSPNNELFQRTTRLAQEAFAAQELGAAQKNTAIDNAIGRFKDAAGLRGS